jgi:hypothetical protein
MADLLPVIETLENRWMRAWVGRDVKELKALTARSFILLTASKPPAILDRPSWLEAVAKRYRCTSYRFGDLDVRGHGSFAVFSARLEIKATMDGHDWSGPVWVTDLWRKGRVRRSWKLAQRIVSGIDEAPDRAAGIRSLQLWR